MTSEDTSMALESLNETSKRQLKYAHIKKTNWNIKIKNRLKRHKWHSKYYYLRESVPLFDEEYHNKILDDETSRLSIISMDINPPIKI